MRTVTSLNTQRHFSERYALAVEATRALRQSKVALTGFIEGCAYALNPFVVGGMYLYGSYLINAGALWPF